MSVTEIDWASDIIDLRDVYEVKEFVLAVIGAHMTCRWCEDDLIEVDGVDLHKQSKNRECDPADVEDSRDDGVPRKAEPTGERPEEDYYDQLATIEDLEKQLQTDVFEYSRNQPEMVADYYKAKYAENYAKNVHEIPEYIENYIDWEKWADDFYDGSEWTEIEVDDMGNCRKFMVRSY